MKLDIIVALIASFASLLIGILNIRSNMKISFKQNEIELKKSKIEVLERRRRQIDEIKVQISNRESGVNNLKNLEDIGRMSMFFTQNFKDVIKLSHLVNKEFSEELDQLLKKIEEFKGREAAGMGIDYEKVFSVVKEMSELNKQIIPVLDKELETLEAKIEKLLDL